MKIAFKNVIIDNFLSFGHAVVELQDRGYTVVSGVNNNPDDSAKSNGSGKSSWGEAIVWCLTGETVRGVTKNIANIHTDGGCSVELNFGVDNHSYQIIRYRDHKTMGSNLKIILDGKDVSGKGIRDTEKLLAEYLPEITASLIGSVIVLGQGLPQRFSNNTPSGRKEVLERLSKSDFMIEDIKSKISARKLVVASDIKHTEGIVLTLNGQKTAIEKTLAELNRLKEELNNKPAFDKVIDDCQTRLNDLDSKISKLQVQKDTVVDTISSIKQEIAMLDTRCQLDISTATEDANKALLTAREARYEITTNISRLQSEITRLESIKDVCPTCGQKLPDIHKPDTAEQHSQLLLLKSELAQRDEDIAKYTTGVEEIRCRINAEAGARKSELQESYLSNDTASRKVNSDISVTEAEMKEVTSLLNRTQTDKALYDSKLSDTEKSIETYKSQIVEISEKLEYNNGIRDLQLARQEIVSKMMTIATRDFRGFLLKNVIEYIDTKAKIYCGDIFDTDKIDFSLDGNNINISYDGKMYENLSGGERQKIDLIIQFSLRDMLCTFTNFSSNILILDEIFDNLDSHGCQRVLDMISKRLSDVDSIFIISHHTDDLSIPYDNEMTVIKNEQGVSTIL